MNQKSRAFAVTAALLAASFAAGPSVAQRQGGILKIYMLDSPASMSIHEEATVVAERPVMGVFNNLVMFDQHVQQNSLGSIIPDLAIGWSWNEDGTDLTFPLREGVQRGVEHQARLDCLPVDIVEELAGTVAGDGFVVPVEVGQHAVHINEDHGRLAAAIVNRPWLSEECAVFGGSMRSPGAVLRDLTVPDAPGSRRSRGAALGSLVDTF
jgi:hypothetical protein